MPRGQRPNRERAEKQKRDWLKLPSEVTRNILYRVGVIDILENAQKVCTAWRKICKDPSMWRVIYMTNFWDPNARPPLQDMCKHAVDRSQGQLVDLTIVDFGNDDLLLYVADRASNLRRLEAAWCYEDIYSDWSDALKKLASLEELSLYETSISEEAIQTAGRYCPMLRTLKVNQRTIDYSDEGCEERAMAIGKYLPELRHLELIGDSLSDIGLKAILDGCRHLELLDLRDCLNIDVKGDMVKRCSQQIRHLKVSNDSHEPYVYESDSSFGATIEPRIHISDEESYNGSSDDEDEYYDDDYDDDDDDDDDDEDDECYDDDEYEDDGDDGYDDDDGDLIRDLDRSMARKENDTKDMSSECIKAGPYQTSVSNPLSYAHVVTPERIKGKVNFPSLESDMANVDADVIIPAAMVKEFNERFANSLYGYFIGKRLAFPVVENYAWNKWSKYGLQKVTMNADDIFFFKFSSSNGLEKLLEHGPYMICNLPIILNKLAPNVSLTKKDLLKVPVWVKLHDVPILAFSEVGLSLIATKLGTPIMLDSYTSTRCMTGWGRCSFARAMIEVNAECGLTDKLVVAIPKLDDSGHMLETIRVEYEWKPPRCDDCKIFGHTCDHCPKKP